MPYLPLSLLLALLCTCGPALLPAQETVDLTKLELLVRLPDGLAEVSGLTVQGDDLLAVEDEHGLVYRMKLANGDLRTQTKFWKDGDYEGIEAVGDEVWVVKSTGTLYRILGQGTAGQRVEKYNTWLTGANDVEGLGYDAQHHRLLLACKDDARDDGRPREDRYVFAFDLDTRVLGEEAVFVIDRGEALEDFAPSALAVHPVSGALYLSSSVENLLLVLAADGSQLGLYELDKELLPQAEGLAFGPDGTLYLSTEAKGGEPARIYKLPLRP
ncbi:SdiA-regulated domain-containing protein [Neolewinella maritima]|nr:SdiA-regulated domain-containing protein [Neolewinella maritima]